MLNSLKIYSRVRAFAAYESVPTLVPLGKSQAIIGSVRKTVGCKTDVSAGESEICLLEVAVPR
jgi:hypothetical protein